MTELEIADWRRRINALYAEIRRLGAAAGWRRAWQHWRDTRRDLFRDHPASPHPDGTAPVLFDYDPAWALSAALRPFNRAPPAHCLDTGADGETVLVPLAQTDGLAPALGQELTVYWLAGYGGGLFLPFRDGGAATYGGGRYLLDSRKGADLGTVGDDRLILDFNFAFNPSCAYDPTWVCPLAPAENRVARPVPAGERAP